jgi:ABC-type transporter Mla subunit MlaD
MHTLRRFLLAIFTLSFSAVLPAQKDQRQPLTQAQVEAIREAGIYPNDRLNLYTKYVDEKAQNVKSLTNRATSAARAQRLDNELQDMTALMDELDDNLDQYTDRKADVRGALKKLNEAAPQWVRTLNALAGEPQFDESRKEAIESCEDLADEAKRLLTEQTDYFNEHKDERGQQRAEPK